MEKFFLFITTLGTSAIAVTAAYFSVLPWVFLGYTILAIALIIKALVSTTPEWNEEDDAQYEWLKQQVEKA